MIFAAAKTLAWILCLNLITCAFARAECPVDVVIVKGRVQNAPPNARVHVHLVYSKEQRGESGEVTVDNGKFSLPIEFLTQSRRAVLVGNLGEKCDRKPKSVVVTLAEGDQEYDRVSLDLAKDFKVSDPTAYTVRSEVVLNVPR
jgi:hypothetical protein